MFHNNFIEVLDYTIMQLQWILLGTIIIFHSNLTKQMVFNYLTLLGDPKTKFLRLFFSAVRRPTIPPTKKTSPDIAFVRRPTSDLGQIL